MCLDVLNLLGSMIDSGSVAEYGVRLLGSGSLFSNEVEGGWYTPGKTRLEYLAYRPDRIGD
jgi:hypothetical protein